MVETSTRNCICPARTNAEFEFSAQFPSEHFQKSNMFACINCSQFVPMLLHNSVFVICLVLLEKKSKKKKKRNDFILTDRERAWGIQQAPSLTSSSHQQQSSSAAGCSFCYSQQIIHVQAVYTVLTMCSLPCDSTLSSTAWRAVSSLPVLMSMVINVWRKKLDTCFFLSYDWSLQGQYQNVLPIFVNGRLF